MLSAPSNRIRPTKCRQPDLFRPRQSHRGRRVSTAASRKDQQATEQPIPFRPCRTSRLRPHRVPARPLRRPRLRARTRRPRRKAQSKIVRRCRRIHGHKRVEIRLIVRNVLHRGGVQRGTRRAESDGIASSRHPETREKTGDGSRAHGRAKTANCGRCPIFARNEASLQRQR